MGDGRADEPVRCDGRVALRKAAVLVGPASRFGLAVRSAAGGGWWAGELQQHDERWLSELAGQR